MTTGIQFPRSAGPRAGAAAPLRVGGRMAARPVLSVDLKLPSGHVALIDEADLPLVAGLAWHIEKRKYTSYVVYRPYVGQRRVSPRIYLHRLLTDAPAGLNVDHVNGDGLDNRRQNLRVCTNRQNIQNQRIREGRLKGVVYTKGRFEARIAQRYIGRFKTEKEAALAYDQAAKQMFGEFARFNFPDGFPVPHAEQLGGEHRKCPPPVQWKDPLIEWNPR